MGQVWGNTRGTPKKTHDFLAAKHTRALKLSVSTRVGCRVRIGWVARVAIARGTTRARTYTGTHTHTHTRLQHARPCVAVVYVRARGVTLLEARGGGGGEGHPHARS